MAFLGFRLWKYKAKYKRKYKTKIKKENTKKYKGNTNKNHFRAKIFSGAKIQSNTKEIQMKEFASRINSLAPKYKEIQRKSK